MTSAHEYTVHAYVNELLDILGAHDGAEKYVDMLTKSMTPFVSNSVLVHQSKTKIAETSKTPREFVAKYDDLKIKNVRDLDVLTNFLSTIAGDEQVKVSLERNAQKRAVAAGLTVGPQETILSHLPKPGAKMSTTEIAELRAKLLKEAKATPRYIPSEVLRKMMEKPKRNVNLPYQPMWLKERPFLSGDFVSEPSTDEVGQPPIGNLPVAQQEYTIIEDLLSCMTGVDGRYIHADKIKDPHAQRTFTVDRTLNFALLELVRRILPLCENYSTVIRFIEEKESFESGLVNQALGAAMRTVARDYLTLIAQLECELFNETLTLQQMWVYVQNMLRTMAVLASIANSVNKGECIGGSVLSLLHERTASMVGDQEDRKLCLYLTKCTCVPYLEILAKWIYKGIVHDPYREFMIEENEALQKEMLQREYTDAYWEKRYTVCRDRMPVFLEGLALTILNTGKYLNVVRLCGKEIQCPSDQKLEYTIKERCYVEQIESANEYASKLLLDLLMQKMELMPRLRSMKRYFLLDQGDFIVHFMDMAGGELKKRMEDIAPQRLDSLLELALRLSAPANADPYKDNLQVSLLPFDLITQLFKILAIRHDSERSSRSFRESQSMSGAHQVDPEDLDLSGLEAFSFDYVVKWPLSLVINKTSLFRYQMLFRFLFYTKHVERQLCDVWISNKSAKRFTLSSSRWFAGAFALRQRMLNFVQHLQYYMLFEVVNYYWHDFETRMLSVSNVDEVLRLHTDFLNNCLTDCMLTNPDLLSTVHKLMVVCVTFSNSMQRLYEPERTSTTLTLTSTLQAPQTKTDANLQKSSSKVREEHVEEVFGSENYELTISKFESNFSEFLVSLLAAITNKLNHSTASEQRLANIVYRLDFNGFYTAKIKKAVVERLSPEKPKESG